LARFVDGYPLAALRVAGGRLRGGAKFLQHRLFDGGGVVLALMQVGASKLAHSCSWGTSCAWI
jgi:hypothetical protein